MKTLRYLIEAALLYICFGIFKILGARTATNLGGWIGTTIGPRLAASRKALKNIAQAFPDKTESDHHEILTDMWENIGRIVGEYPHLKQIVTNNITYEGLEHLQKLDGAAIFFSGHIANWEIAAPILNIQNKDPVRSLYRAPNNPFVRSLLNRVREKAGHYLNIPKSKSGVRDMVRTLQGGQKLAVLIDQKYNQGEAVPFFGRPAMTSPAFVQLAQKFNCPLIPVQMIRENGPTFKVIFHPPLTIDGMREYDAIEAAHKMLESWITAHPGQWLWLHRRWDSAALRETSDE